MFEATLDVLQRTSEWQVYQKSGLWNANTLSAIGVIVTSCMEMWGLWKQGRKIWNMRSGDSVSVTMFNYTMWYFLFCGIYGAYINSGAAAFSGFTTSIVQIPILIGLLRFKKFQWWESALALLFPMQPLAMICVPETWRGALFVSLSVGIALAMAAEPLELLKTEKTGAVEIRLFLIYLLTTTIWMVFVSSVGDVPLIINQSIATVMIVSTVVMWCWYRAQEPAPPPLLYKFYRILRKALR